MRKCRSCGYLLLGEGDACTRCGTPLSGVTAGAEPPPPPAGSFSAPPAPPAAWGAPPPAPPGPPGPAGPPGAAGPPPFGRLSYPPPPPVGVPPAASLPPLRESWQPVAMPAPVRAPRSNRLGLIALVVAMAVALVFGAGALHFGSDSLPAGTSAFVAGNGVIFTSPDGVYRARFPQAATMETMPPTSNGLTLDRASAKTDAYEIVAVSSVAAAPVPPASVNVLLEAGLAAEIANLNGKLQSKHETTFAGMPAIEGSFKGSDGYAARILLVASGANVFEVVVHAKSGTDKLFKAFEASLTIY